MIALLLALAELIAAPSYVALADPPAAIAISASGRVFVAFSRADDPSVARSLVELRGSGASGFPPGFAQDDGPPGPRRLLSITALTVDAEDRLWILDSGKVGTNVLERGAAQLLAIDLASGQLTRRIAIPAAAAGADAELRGLQVDSRRGVAYVGDAAAEGPNAILVVELASGEVVRRLEGLGETRPDPVRVLRSEGRALVLARGPRKGAPLRRGVSALALTPDGDQLWFASQTSHRLSRVPTAALTDRALGDAELRAIVVDAGDMGFATAAMLCDPSGELYVGDVEGGAVRRYASRDRRWELIADGEWLTWPSAIARHPDGSLLVGASQANRGPALRGWDQRRRPFLIVRLVLDEPHAAR